MHLFDDWEQCSKRLASLASRLSSEGAAGEVAVPKSANHILAPLSYPNKLIMMGANYLDHIQQDTDFANFERTSKLPCLFMKPPTKAIVGSGASGPYPYQTKKIDWETKLDVAKVQQETPN